MLLFATPVSSFSPVSRLSLSFHIYFFSPDHHGSDSCSSDKRTRNVAVARSSCIAECKGKEIEPSTRGDRDYKSKVKLLGTRSDTPPRRRFFPRILKVAASFFTRLRSPKTETTAQTHGTHILKNRGNGEQAREKKLPRRFTSSDELFMRLGRTSGTQRKEKETRDKEG